MRWRLAFGQLVGRQSIGVKLFENFHSIEFQDYCNEPERITDVAKLSEALSNVLDDL